MQRKIYANIELQTRSIYYDFQNDVSLNDHFPFSPSEITLCFYQYPLKILTPHAASDAYCQWIYPVTFGGGLVAGDDINISVLIGNGCCVLIATLSFPKVYGCGRGLDCQQHVKYNIGSRALLCVLQDPVICFKTASYIQTQSYYLNSDANVVSVDWFTSGRYERGERWDFFKLKCVSTFYIDDKVVFKEAQLIQNTPLMNIKQAMKSYNIFGTCFVIGPYVSFLKDRILSELGKCHGYGEKYKADKLFSVSSLYLNDPSETIGCIIRFASESVSEAIRKIEELLEPLFHVIGENPFRHK